MTQIEQIKNEIERLLTAAKENVIESNKNGFPLNSSMHTGEEIAYEKVLKLINSLPQEPASKELEEAAKINAATMVLNGIAPDATVEQLREIAYKCFINGANRQKRQDIEDMLKSDNTEFIKCYEKGKSDMKQQMMKDAVDADARYICGEGTIFDPQILPDEIEVGQKVKLIIIKED